MTKKCSEITSDYFKNHPVLKNHSELLELIRKIFQDETYIWLLKVPGRVNLIGEHVDYNNGPVLPCAIDREIILCIAPNSSGVVQIANVNQDYRPIEFSISKTIKPYERGHWGNYIKAGVIGIVDHLRQSGYIDGRDIKGF